MTTEQTKSSQPETKTDQPQSTNNPSPKKSKPRRATTKKSTGGSKGSHPTYMKMSLEAITKNSHFGKGLSRPAIANYIKGNYGLGSNKDTGIFNANLRKALADGVTKGFLEHGESEQRFKLTDKGRSFLNPKKKGTRSKSPSSKKPTRKTSHSKTKSKSSSAKKTAKKSQSKSAKKKSPSKSKSKPKSKSKSASKTKPKKRSVRKSSSKKTPNTSTSA